MAFSTIQGSGGAPDSFVGTSGVDTIALVNETGNFFLGAQGDNDVIAFVSSLNAPGVISVSTLRGGSGADTFADSANMTVLSGVFLNGNAGADIFNFTNAALIGSTLQGGQGADQINLTGDGVASSLVNGNRDNDIIVSTGGATSSSLFGGQGDDTITLSTAAHTSSIIDGGEGDDTISTVGNINIVGTVFNGGGGNDDIDLSTVTTAANGGVVINGGDGNDTLVGTAGRDTIDGGAGNDLVTGGAAADQMSGSGGTNQFAIAIGDTFAGTGLETGTVDVITDWSSSDFLSGLAFDAGVAISTTTGVDFGAAATAALAAGTSNVLAAVGSGTSFTSVLFNVTAGAVTDAVQLTNSTFTNATAAQSTILAAQIIA